MKNLQILEQYTMIIQLGNIEKPMYHYFLPILNIFKAFLKDFKKFSKILDTF